MTVEILVLELEHLIKENPENKKLEVLRSGNEHFFYCLDGPEVEDVEKTKDGDYCEYFNDSNMFKGSKKIKALVFW